MGASDYNDDLGGVSPEDRALREKFTDRAAITYRGLTGSVVPKGLMTLYKAPWWAVPVNLDGDSGYIHYLNYKLLELVEPEPVEEVIEAREEFIESRVCLDKNTGKIWATTNGAPDRWYCLNDSFTWPMYSKRDHWVPLYEKVWNAA